MLGPLQRGWRRIICVASGPSLSAEQVAQVDAARTSGAWRVIVINSSWRVLPDADVLYACDASWWNVYAADVRAGFRGECWTRDMPAAQRYGLRHIPAKKGEGLSKIPGTINEGGNSGYQALGLAHLFGLFAIARRIVLVGYDMQNTGGRTHHHGDHPKPLANQHTFKHWVDRFGPLARDLQAAGVDVVNCTAETALECFPRGELGQVLHVEHATP